VHLYCPMTGGSSPCGGLSSEARREENGRRRVLPLSLLWEKRGGRVRHSEKVKEGKLSLCREEWCLSHSLSASLSLVTAGQSEKEKENVSGEEAERAV